MPFYRSQAKFFSKKGYITLLLHYFDAGRSKSPSTKTYGAWAGSLAELVRICRENAAQKERSIFVVGYSLGFGSVGSWIAEFASGWNGDLVWKLTRCLFFMLKGMPPLLILHGALDDNIPVSHAKQLIRLCELGQFDCDSHIYPDQGHGFGDTALKDADERTLVFFAAQPAQEPSSSPALISAI